MNHGRVAYEAYMHEYGGIPLDWETLTQGEQTAWDAAARAIVREILGPETCPPTARAPLGYPGASS